MGESRDLMENFKTSSILKLQDRRKFYWKLIDIIERRKALVQKLKSEIYATRFTILRLYFALLVINSNLANILLFSACTSLFFI